MTPGNYTIKIQRGATFNLRLSASDLSGPINFMNTYDRAELTVYPKWVKEKGIHIAPLLVMSTTLHSISLTATGIILSLSAVKTTALLFNEGIYELKVRNILVEPILVDTLLEGDIIIKGLG